MSRLSHKKSRKGCRKCKQRHVKCDETKPECLKCVAGGLRCPYLDDASSIQTPSSASSPSVSFNTPSSSLIAESTLGSLASLSTEGHRQGVLNMAHLELFYHVQTEEGMNAIFQVDKEESSKIMRETFRHAMGNPYLMHELLSFAALHLSILNPSRGEMWKHQATELQTYALTLFNNTAFDSTTDYLPPFLFSSFIGSHMLHDAISAGGEDFGPFLDKFVGYLRIARGVKMQLNGNNWEALMESPFKILVEAGLRIPSEQTASAPELVELERLLQSADISPASLQIYQKALNQLKSAFQAHSTITDDKSRATAVSAIFAWPILASPEYTDLLAQRRPESLAILAHYAVLLHWHRDIWVFGGGGGALIESVGRYLGGYWEPWLSLPKSVLER